MNILKQLWSGLVYLIKKTAQLPWALADYIAQRKELTETDAREAERLDRIRNPSKYLGK